jgi:Bifunctional DNA primase/polymerase, N-terminal/Primase C terminal 1 (PriCT-1)
MKVLSSGKSVIQARRSSSRRVEAARIFTTSCRTEGVEVRNRTKVLRRRIDIRGEGGSATAPPSLHPSGQNYAWLSFDASSKLPTFEPEWIAGNSRPATLPSGRQTSKVRNVVAYIRRINAVAGKGGHNATFRAACKLRDAGLSEEEALAVLSDWNETNTTPAWSAGELAHKVRSAFDSHWSRKLSGKPVRGQEANF